MNAGEIFRSTDWTPIGEVAGCKIVARLIRYDELGTPRCEFATWSDDLAAYRFEVDETGVAVYVSEDEPGVFFHPAYDPDHSPRPPRIEVRLGWRIVPRYLADGRPWVYPAEISVQSARRPPEPDFSDPDAVEQLEAIVSRYRDSLPPPPGRIDLYRACEGDNPALLRGE